MTTFGWIVLNIFVFAFGLTLGAYIEGVWKVEHPGQRRDVFPRITTEE